MVSAEQAYKGLESIRSEGWKASDLTGSMEFIRHRYPADMDRIIAVLVDVRCKIADDILHRQTLEDDADRRQGRIEF